MLLMETGNKPIEQLPIQIYESVIDIVAGEATMLFVPLTYILATEEAERIGVDHVARMAQSNENTTNSYGTRTCHRCDYTINYFIYFQLPITW